MNFEYPKLNNEDKEDLNRKLLNFLENSKFFELKNKQKFLELEYPRVLAFFGSSASGKTFIIDSLREFAQDNNIEISKRLITRPQRLGDNLKENKHVSKEELKDLLPVFHTFDPDSYGSWDRAIFDSKNPINWVRKMENNREEQYAFDKSPYYLKDNLHILSGNNDLARQKDSITENSNEVIWIGVYTPDEIRKERILKRSPDLSIDEINYRLGDSSENILPLADLIIKNYGEFSDNIEDIKILLNQLKEIRKNYVSKLGKK